MTYAEFLDKLKENKRNYNWVLTKSPVSHNYCIRADENDKTYCPITGIYEQENGKFECYGDAANLNLVSDKDNQRIVWAADGFFYHGAIPVLDEVKQMRRDMLEALGIL
jgi:hypothetical protein